jgi:GT2 family glycosyltransferase
MEELLRAAALHPNSVLSPVVLSDEQRVSFAGAYKRDDGDLHIVHLYEGQPVSQLPKQAYEADALHGCALFARLATFRQAGKMSEEFFLYYEETEWCLKAAKSGVRFLVNPQARVHHLKKSHGRGLPALTYVYYLLRNARIFNDRLGFSGEAAERRLRSEFVPGWRSRIANKNPGFLAIFDRAIEAAFSDGRARLLGRVDVAERLDKVEMDTGRRAEGRVEVVRDGVVRGWAVQRSAAKKGVAAWAPDQVWLVIDDVPVAQVTATRSRPDVARAGYCETSGFTLKIPNELIDGGVHTVEVRSAADGRCLPFTAHNRSRSTSLRLASGSMKDLEEGIRERPPKYRGRINGITNGELRGWAVDEANPNFPIILDLVLNGELLEGVVAAQFRADLEKAGVGSGRHGFSVALPSRFLVEDTVKVELKIAREASALETREIRVPARSEPFRADFDFDGFLRWAYLHDRTPIAAFEMADAVQKRFAANKSDLVLSAHQMADEPLVTIIMPVYDRSEVVLYAVDSVHTQSYSNWELILIDDGSRDGSAAVIEAYLRDQPDPRITLLSLAFNSGVSAARNAGLRQASGEIVAYLDSDNIWDPEFLRVMVDALGRNPLAEAAYCGQEIWEALPEFGEIERRMVRACPFNRSRLETRNYIDLNAFVHRRSCIDQYGEFREDIRRLVDWELILRFTARKPPVFVPALLSIYRVNIVRNQITRTEDFGGNFGKVQRVLSGPAFA